MLLPRLSFLNNKYFLHLFQVLVKAVLQEELKGRRFLYRSAADLVAVRGAFDRRALLEAKDFNDLRTVAKVNGTTGGLVVVG